MSTGPDIRHRLPRRGLTLIEVMVALGIMVILLGGLFTIVQTSLRTVLLMDESSSREDEISNLTDVFRQGMRELPARASLLAGPVRVEGESAMLIGVQRAPGFLTWSVEPEAERTAVLLAFLPQPDNLWTVAIKRFEADEEPGDLAQLLSQGRDIPWLPLVADLGGISAQFYSPARDEWRENWDEPDIRPGLIRWRLVWERETLEHDFWIPPVQIQADLVAPFPQPTPQP